MGQMKELAIIREELGIGEQFPLFSGPGTIMVDDPHGHNGRSIYKSYETENQYHERLSEAIGLHGQFSVTVVKQETEQ